MDCVLFLGTTRGSSPNVHEPSPSDLRVDNFWHDETMTLRSTTDDQTIDPLAVVPFEGRFHPDGRPWLFTNMVSSLDGAAAVDGLSGPMGDDDDRSMFRALRASADAIIVGAGTVNAESYRPPQLSDEVSAARERAGRNKRPIIAVISASLSVDPTLELFTDPSYRATIFTSERADAANHAALEGRADIVTLGATGINMVDVVNHLGNDGYRTILSEGGPTLNGQLIHDGLIDEWNLTLAPLLVGGSAPRPARSTNAGNQPQALPDYQLARLWTGDRAVFSRWIRPEA